MPSAQEIRQDEARLLLQVQQQRLEPAIQALNKLLKIRLDRMDRELRVCPPSEFQVKQGVAQTLHGLYEEINGPLIDIKHG